MPDTTDRDAPDPRGRPWLAEVETTVDEAARRIAREFPALAGLAVEPFAAGWDNTAFLVDGAWVFRFPRKAFAVQFLDVEIRALPWLAGHLPWPITAPRWAYAGGPGGFAAGEGPFAGYRLLPGRPLVEVGLDDAATSALAAPLGAFLRALHAVSVDEAAEHGVPVDPLGKADVARRGPGLSARLEDLHQRGLVDATPLRSVVIEAVPCGGSVVLHGDLDARHLLVDERGVTGVIDWGDAHRGPPGTDLAVMWHALPVAAHGAFRAAYGPIGAADARLARFRALDVATAVLLWALDTGAPAPLRAARATLSRLAAVPRVGDDPGPTP